MKAQIFSPGRRTFLSTCVSSTWRLALVASLVFGVALITGYTATAKAPTLIKMISQLSGPPATPAPLAEHTRYVQPSIHRVERLLTVPNPLDPIVFTDRANYFPGETAFITGLGFWPNEIVTLQVVHTDGTSNDGGGHTPWNVTADALGSFDSSWFVDPDDSAGSSFLLTATGNSSGQVAEAAFTDGSANLDTCENGPASAPTTCTGEAWTNGNVNGSKGHYAEGQSVPYRTIFENLTAGNTYTLTVEYDTTQGGKHAFDYLTSFDTTEPTPGNNPCTRKQGGSIVSVCDPDVFVTTPIPVDQNVANGPNGIPGGGDDIVPIAGVFTLFNGNALSIVNPGSPYTLSGTYAGNSSTSIRVQFTATSSIAVLAWGGHISTRLNWGVGNSAIAINGSPYHMRLTGITCSGAGETCNVGNQDHQLSADAVFFPIELTIIKETNPDFAESKQFNYTTTGANLGPFSLTPPNGTTPAQTQFSLLDTTARSVTESDPSAAAPQFNLTDLSCTQTDGGLGIGDFTTDLGTRTVNFTPKEGQFLSCTFVNEQVLGKIIVDKVTVPGGDPTSFDFTTTYGSPFSLTDGATPNDSGFIVPGTYQVTETANADYTTSATCTSSLGHPADNPNSIDLDPGETVTCTFTNTKKPKLTVTKIVTNNNGGTKQISDFPLFVDGNSVTSGVKNTSTIGSHTVSETSDPGYTATIGGDCAADGSITLAAGDDKSCTITNDDKPAKLIVIKHVINDNGGTATAANFTLDSGGANDSPDNFAGAESPGTEVTLDAGSYTVTESGPSGYTASYSPECSGSIANGQEKTCTVTNDDQPGKLIVIKHVINDNGGTATAANFTLDSGGANDSPDDFPGAESPGTEVTLNAGSYNVTESGPAGYSASYSADCSGTIANGQEKTCTVTNDDQAAKLIVIKHVINNNGGTATAANFTLDSGGSNDSPDNFPGAESPGTEVTLDAGSYNVTESGPSGYTASYSAYCSGTIANGQTKTCTVTNDDKAAKLIVIKHVINDNGGTATAANFTLDSGGANDSPDNFAGAESPGTEVTLDAGSYNVSETGPAGYAASYSAYCSGTIANGQTKTCTVTNDDISPTLRVIKDLVPDLDSGLFNLRIDGATAGTGANVGDGGTTGSVPVNAGNHTVSETAGNSTSLADYVTLIGGDCAANGSVSLALAQNKTCTITNTRKGKAEIVKTVAGLPPAAGQSFTFELRQGATTMADGTTLETKNTDASGNISFTTKLIPGDTYQICEWVFPGWNTNLVGDGPLFVPNSMIPPALPNPNVNNLTVCANFTVQPGQTRTFTVNNSPPPGGRALTIGFWKNWASCASSNGKGQKPMLDLALGIASANTTNPPGGLVASAQNPGAANWPNYAAAWYLVLKGNPLSTKDLIYPATDCLAAINLLNKSTSDGKKKMSSDPLFNMTAQLVAAELNRFMGAGINGTTIVNIDRAVLLNGKYKFNGLTYSPKLTTADTNLANCLATQLDNYNNGNPVSLCP